MSRYVNIDGDWVNYAIKAYGPGRYEDDEYAIPIERLYSAPSIDIIRCRECKYWHKNRKAGDGTNVFDICYDFQADDFCSYGEPKEKLKGSERLVKGSEKPNNSKERSRG